MTEFDERAVRLGATLLQRLVKNDMGIGLAANQVGIGKRAFAWDMSYYRDGDQGAILNPEIVMRDGFAVYEEGCLSLPDFYWPVERAAVVGVTGHAPDGTEIEFELDGIAARLFQHEIDHLDGLLIFDRLDPEERPSAFAAADEALNQVSSGRWRPRRRTRRIEL